MSSALLAHVDLALDGCANAVEGVGVPRMAISVSAVFGNHKRLPVLDEIICSRISADCLGVSEEESRELQDGGVAARIQ